MCANKIGAGDDLRGGKAALLFRPDIAKKTRPENLILCWNGKNKKVARDNSNQSILIKSSH